MTAPSVLARAPKPSPDLAAITTTSSLSLHSSSKVRTPSPSKPQSTTWPEECGADCILGEQHRGKPGTPFGALQGGPGGEEAGVYRMDGALALCQVRCKAWR